MTARTINLRSERPLLVIVSMARSVHTLNQEQWALLGRTMRGTPGVMVKVSGGARTVRGVGQHIQYIGRGGELGVETDMGERIGGKQFHKRLIDDWDLAIDAGRRRERTVREGRPVKLVHNLIFSMPAGTSPKKVLAAVRSVARSEWQLNHRYALALHTDGGHPHVHVVLKAVGEDGRRLNIRKATLRSWRQQFAERLLELGVAANATERAVRGEARSHKKDSIYRAHKRRQSTHMKDKLRSALLDVGREQADTPASDRIRRTRAEVVEGWRTLASHCTANGRHDLALSVRTFLGRMRPAQTEREQIQQSLWRSKAVRQQKGPLHPDLSRFLSG